MKETYNENNETNSINFLEYTLAEVYSALCNLERAIDEENYSDEITNAILLDMYRKRQYLENYIVDCKISN